MQAIDRLISSISNGSIEPNVVAPCISLDDFQCSTSKEDVLTLLTSAREGTLDPLHTGTVVNMLCTQHAYNQPLIVEVTVTPTGMKILPKHLGLVLPLNAVPVPRLNENTHCVLCQEELGNCICEYENLCGACEMVNCICLEEAPDPTCDECGSRDCECPLVPEDCSACGERMSYVEQTHCKNCNMVFKPEPLPDEFFTPALPTTAWHDAT